MNSQTIERGLSDDRGLIVGSATSAIAGWSLFYVVVVIHPFHTRQENLIALALVFALLFGSVSAAYAVLAGEPNRKARFFGRVLLVVASIGIGLLLLLPVASFPFY